ncbi:hypothetical protein ACFXN2_24650 [Streptomyces kronopolitis]|uniref:hypothetical protein n=1 Tax=Streptomyces kronopolitis TaxID=1612435 RepID=UPI0020BE1BE5|nr:hypothetical protein [Streptomyces kronopolitis]MCL6297879.1 hypothetical protein [Streptomyces kronopolitis]
MTSNGDPEPQHGRLGDVPLDGTLVRPYIIPGDVRFVPSSEAVAPCSYPCDHCKRAGRQ